MYEAEVEIRKVTLHIRGSDLRGVDFFVQTGPKIIKKIMGEYELEPTRSLIRTTLNNEGE